MRCHPRVTLGGAEVRQGHISCLSLDMFSGVLQAPECFRRTLSLVVVFARNSRHTLQTLVRPYATLGRIADYADSGWRLARAPLSMWQLEPSHLGSCRSGKPPLLLKVCPFHTEHMSEQQDTRAFSCASPGQAESLRECCHHLVEWFSTCGSGPLWG